MLSIVSYPERGNDGRNSYRGNCSGKLIEDLINQYKVQSINDYMVGSGTTEHVAARMGIESHCYDLNRGFDVMSMDLPERSSFTFWHPPYGSMIIYSGEQYSAEDVLNRYGFDPRVNDLSRCRNWDEFVEKMNYCCMKMFSALDKGGRLAVLMGDYKQKGKLYSMLADIVKPGCLEQIIIKAQHNCMSYGKSYASKNFVPICHEYVMVVKKENSLYYEISLPKKVRVDIRNMDGTATWRDVVYAVIENNGGRAMTLSDLYAQIDGHKKAQKNANWRAKVRQTLQLHPELFRQEGRGVWCAA